MKIAIMQADSNGCYPIPAAKGGAVSTLVEHLLDDNNKNKQADITVVSYYDELAVQQSRNYKNVEFIWVKIPILLKFLDSVLFSIVNKFFSKRKAVSYKSLFSLLWYIRVGSIFLKNNEFDKLILENNIPMAWMIKRSQYSGEYYYHLHNVPRTSAGCKDVFEKCAGFLCVSKFVAKQISSEFSAIGKIPNEKIHILYNCIDTDLFKPYNDDFLLDEYREKYRLSKNDNVVIFSGRLSREKGIDIVVNSVKEVPNVKLLIVGSYMHSADGADSFQNELHKMTDSIKDRVIFTGYINQKEMPKLYSLADVAVLPSMWDEPAGLTIIEAMACGIPVITTNSGGIPEYVGDKAIILERDSNLKENISIYIRNCKNLNLNGIDHVKENFGINGYMKRLIDNLV